jgi:hypothetical protein
MASDQSAIRNPKSTIGRSAIGGLLLCLCLSCASAPPPAPPTAKTSAGIYYEEPLLPPPPELRLEIVSLDEQVSADKSTVALSGVLRNGGGRATTQLQVTIHALDASSNVLSTFAAAPSSTHVPPSGTVTFSAVTGNDPNVRQYHVEAIGR